MKTVTDLIINFNKKRYRRTINKNRYSFKMNSYPVSIFNQTALAYGIMVKNQITQKSLLYYIPFKSAYYLKEQCFDGYILNYTIRKINRGG